MIADAIATAELLFLAAILWAGAAGAALAFVVLVVAVSLGPLVAPAARAARKRVTGPLAAERAPQATESHPPRKRAPVPSWAHTEPYDYQDAA